jgi:hypothetical protein
MIGEAMGYALVGIDEKIIKCRNSDGQYVKERAESEYRKDHDGEHV